MHVVCLCVYCKCLLVCLFTCLFTSIFVCYRTSASGSTAGAAAPVPKLTYKQLEDQINKVQMSIGLYILSYVIVVFCFVSGVLNSRSRKKCSCSKHSR